MFSELDDKSMEGLAASLVPLEVPGGDTLMREGEEPDAFYLVVSGRLRAFVALEDGSEVAVGEIGPGEVVGEMAMLSPEPRSATVRAVRDTHLLQLSSTEFRDLILEHPSTLLEVTKLIVARLHRSIHRRTVSSGVKTIAVVPAGGGPLPNGFVRALAAELGSHGSVALLDAESADRRFGEGSSAARADSPDSSALTGKLHKLESDVGVIIYVADDEDTPWTRRSVRQADRVLLVADARSDRRRSSGELSVEGLLTQEARTGLEIALIHGAATKRPTRTAPWLKDRSVDRHHHLQSGSGSDIARLARHLTGRRVGLVLSGGGARGFAHIGVIRAFVERGVPIDAIGGASFGAVVAALFALDLDVDVMVQKLKETTVDVGSLVDVTIPAVSLARGGKLTRGLRKIMDGAHIEDLWRQFFCVSADLSDGDLVIHESGPLWHAARASVAIPGVFPPVRSDDGHVLVDGGVMNNLPVDVMRSRMDGGVLFAVNLRAGIDLPAEDLPDTGILSGWRITAKRLNPRSERSSVPGIMEVLLRVTEVGSVDYGEQADVLFRPPVDDFALLDFSTYREVMEVGYRHASEVFDALDLGALLG